MNRLRVTLADVAREAGTSTAVVSYVLNDGPRPVADATRERVRKAISKLDYSPDRMARALRRRKSGMVGLLVPDVTLPFFGALARGIESAMYERGELLLTANTNFDSEAEDKAVRAFGDAGVDALMIASEGQSVHARAARLNIRVVWVHEEPLASPATVIRSDHQAAGHIAADHLVSAHGCRSLAFIGAPGENGAIFYRYQGFIDGTGTASPSLIATDQTPEDAYEKVVEMAARGSVDGIVVGTNGQASATLRALTDSGLRVPEDVAVVGFDNGPRGRYSQLVLSSVEQDVNGIAKTACELALDHDVTTTRRLFPVHLSLGETCGCK